MIRPRRSMLAAALLVASVALLSALPHPRPLGAQQPTRPASRDTTRVDTVRVQRLAPQVVTGARLSAASNVRVPGRADAVAVRAIESSDPAPVARALARLPGVSLSDDQGSRAQPTLDVRGFEASPVVGVAQGVSVFLDGVRINEADAQEVHFDLIPAEAVDRAELVRGPGALFGKNSLAGALLLSTRRGADAAPLQLSVATGAFGSRSVTLSAAETLGRGVDAYVMARSMAEDGYRRDTPARTAMLFANVGRGHGSRELVLSVLAARDKISEAGSLPESWLRVDPRLNYTSGDFFRPHLLHVALRGSHPLGGGALRGNVFARRNRSEQFNVNVGRPSTRAFVLSRTMGATGEWSRVAIVAARPLELALGAEVARSRVNYHVYQEATTDSPTLDPGCDANGLCEDARANSDDAAVFAQSVLDLTARLSLTAAGRLDYVRLPFRDLRDPTGSGTATFRNVGPRVGATYRAGGSVRLYASASSAYRAPAALELACASEQAPCSLPFSLGEDPPLAPVRLWTYEGGARWTPLPRVTLDAAVYRTDVRDEIVFVASERTAGYFQNVPRTRRTGAELAAGVALPADARLFGTYSYVAATYRSTVRLATAVEGAEAVQPGDRFPLSPAHRLTAGVGATHMLGHLRVDGELSMRAVSSQYLRGDEANNLPPLAGYAVSDLRLGVDRERYGLTVDVTNLFDRRYETFGVYASNPRGAVGGPLPAVAPVERFLTPGYPRALSVSVEMKP